MQRLTKIIFSNYFTKKHYFCSSTNEVIRRVPHTKDEFLKLFTQILPPEKVSNSIQKVLKVSIVGCPNSGKSSLVNMLTRWNVCGVSGKINTTRSKQTAIYTDENIQLCFIDLPGLVGQKRKFQFKIEKSLIRDPHSGVFDSDLILVVVDVSHLNSRQELSLDVMKILQYFKDKPSVLVLNKIDKMSKQSQLFNITYNLTKGVVGGHISHIDKYANRSRKEIPGYLELLTDQRMELLMEKHNPQLLSGGINNSQKCINSTGDKEELLESTNKMSISDVVSESTNQNDSLEPTNENIISDSTNLNVDTDLTKPNDSTVSMNEKASDEAEYHLKKILEMTDITLEDELKEPILDVLKKQMMMKSATRQDVIERRKDWWKVTRQLEISKETSWKQFDEVFAVSSVTGKGIDRLRSYLLSRAKPGRWYFHSSLICDTEPEELAKLVLRARCLDILPDEIPYGLLVDIEQFDKAPDGAIQVMANIKCRSRRDIMAVIGKNGYVISSISDSARELMEKSYQASVSLKVEVTMQGVERPFKYRMHRASHVRQMYPRGATQI